MIYCSSPADPLAHTLELTLKNISENSAICTAGTQVGSPQIMISFVYGTTGDPQNRGQGTIGYYRTATAQIPMQFLGPPPPLIKRLDSSISAGTQMAVRYVRRL